MAVSKYSKRIYDQTLAFIVNGGAPSDYAISRFLNISPHTIKAWREANPAYQHMIDNAVDLVGSKISQQAFNNATRIRKEKFIIKDEAIDKETGELVVVSKRTQVRDVVPTHSDVMAADKLGLRGRSKTIRKAVEQYQANKIDALELETVYLELGLKTPKFLEVQIQKEHDVYRMKRINELSEMKNHGLLTPEQFEKAVNDELGVK